MNTNERTKRLRSFQVGDTVAGRYLLMREIATGGGGVVFQAEHLFTKRPVALKVLTEEQQPQEALVARLLREARALNLARHPNVVDVLDAGRLSEGGPYVALELLQGRPLDGILASRGRLSPADAIWVVRSIASAVAKMHRHGLVHRDIKAGNVFVSYSDTGEEIPKLLDYGTATHRSVPEKQRLTKDNSIMGTPEYMAPEQLMGNNDPDPRVDVYALGVLLYECLTGAVPYEGSFGEILLKVHQQQFFPVDQLVSELPRELVSVVKRAMATEASERFQDAQEVFAALGSWAHDQHQGAPLLGLGGQEKKAAPEVEARRRFTRVPYVTPVFLRGKDGQEFFGKSQDVSTGGMLVVIAGQAEDCEMTEARFVLPTSGKSVSVSVNGKWARGRRGQLALGLEFEDLEAACAEDIHRFVLSTLEHSPEREGKGSETVELKGPSESNSRMRAAVASGVGPATKMGEKEAGSG